MANFEDIKERVKSGLHQTWEKIQESSVYNKLKDRFENLSPVAQKLVLSSMAILIFLLVIAFPLSAFMSGSDSLTTYEAQRDLIRDLFKVQQDSSGTLGLSPAPATEALKSNIEDQLRVATLLPEQITGIDAIEVPENLPKDRIDGAVKVALRKLNLRQIVDVGHQITAIHPAMKMVDLLVDANSQDPRYFDVVYKFITLKIPVYTPPPPDEEPTKNKKGAKPVKKGSDE